MRARTSLKEQYENGLLVTSVPFTIPTGPARMPEGPTPSMETPLRESDLPATVIEPRKGWLAIDLKGLWRYHELLYFLAWRDIKVQYKQTVLGPLWAILRPLANLVIFSFVFGKLAGIPSDGVPYPIFVYAGLLPWMFFSGAVASSSNSMLNHAHLLSKIYFPRVLLPAASISSCLVTFLISCALYAWLMVWYAHLPGPTALLLPLLVVLTALTALGMGYLLAGLAVIYRDVRFLVPSLVQLWMYLSPVIYPATLVPERYRWLLLLNPMTGIIGGFRSVLLNQPVDWLSLGISVLFAGVLFVVGLFVFHQTERRFADVA